ncbi:MAG: tyrosine-type recombinase/integrase [Rhodocyclales bacterium]|nr:tyrosine-type recombinase/integrase [Rhodocyclales bacterium]
MLTKRSVEKEAPSSEPKKVPDAKGLYLFVTPQGSKSWRYDYRFGGKRRTMTFGLFPAVTLDEARNLHFAARSMLSEGRDPMAVRKVGKSERLIGLGNTFDKVWTGWFDSKKERRSEVWRQGHQLNFTRDLSPAFGNIPLADITTEALLGVLEKVAKRSGVKTAERVRQTAIQVFDYGRRKLKITANVARALTGWAEIPAKRNHAWLKESEIPAFLDAVDAYPGYLTTRYAVQLLFLTFVRKGELREAKWSEFDLENAIWVVPAERMKMLTEHKANRHNAHDVPLSRQAIQLLEELRPISAGSEYLFPGNSSLEKPIAKSTLNVMFGRMGYSKALTPHGIRATVSTILNERGYRGDLIERQLAHVDSNGTRAAYNHAKYLDERREMMQAWADILDELRLAPQNKGTEQWA